MKNTMLQSLSLLGISFVIGLSVSAQEPKIKSTAKEDKYKTEDLKVKDKKDEVKYKEDDLKVKEKKDETKYKDDDLKIKVKKDESKYKEAGLKVKDEANERKVKGEAHPMRKSMSERTVLKTGEEKVTTKEQIAPVAVETTTIEPIAAPAPVPVMATPVKKPVRKYTAHKKSTAKPVATAKPNTGVKYITRTKVVRDTVYVPSEPERIVSTQTEYLHDTVTVTRVDTVTKIQKVNTYTGYNVPKGDFKKVKLKRDKKDGTVHMKTKTDKD